MLGVGGGDRGAGGRAPLWQLGHLREQVFNRLRSLRRILGQDLGEEHVELVWQDRIQLGRRGDRGIDGGIGHLHAVRADEREAAREHLEREHAHGIDVRAAIDVVAHHLLRRHVSGRADRQPNCGEVGRLAGSPSKAEVREHRASVGVDQHVGRLEVAMDDAGVVGVLQSVSDLAQVTPCGKGVERAAVQDVAQRAATNQRHGEVGHPLGKLEVVDRQDVRMVELGQRLRFGLEPLHEAVVLEELWRQGLQGHLAPERLLHRAVDHRHAATTKALDDLVAADPGAGEVLHLSMRSALRSASAPRR